MKKALSRSFAHRTIGLGLALAAAAALAAATLSVIPRDESTSMPGVAAPSLGARDDRPSTTPTPSPAADDPTVAPTAAPVAPPPAPVGPRTSTEVQPGGVTNPAPVPVAPLPPLTRGGLPATSSALGRIVAGFPAIIPLAEKSTVVSSSVGSSGARIQATVDATTDLSPNLITDFYRTTFAALSLAGADVPATGNSSGTVFARGNSSVTLTVTPLGDGARYSLIAVLDVTP